MKIPDLLFPYTLVDEMVINFLYDNSLVNLKTFSEELIKPFFYPSSSNEPGFGIKIIESYSVISNFGISFDNQSHFI